MEEDIELLEEMKANCIKGMMKGAIYTDPKAERKALAIENILNRLKELEEKIEKQELAFVKGYTEGGYNQLNVMTSKIKEIRDKAEVMDYYTLPDVIDDLNKLLEDK